MNAATPQIGVPDTVKVLGTAPGFTCVLELFSAIRTPYPFLQIEAAGQRGTLITRYDNYATVAQTQQGERMGALRLSDMIAGEMEHFLACVKGETAPRCSVEDMVYVTRCLEAVQESLSTGKPVDIPKEEVRCEAAP
jgi:predicted dehydrogenase